MLEVWLEAKNHSKLESRYYWHQVGIIWLTSDHGITCFLP